VTGTVGGDGGSGRADWTGPSLAQRIIISRLIRPCLVVIDIRFSWSRDLWRSFAFHLLFVAVSHYIDVSVASIGTINGMSSSMTIPISPPSLRCLADVAEQNIVCCLVLTIRLLFCPTLHTALSLFCSGGASLGARWPTSKSIFTAGHRTPPSTYPDQGTSSGFSST
jgi:hypothetical protein